MIIDPTKLTDWLIFIIFLMGMVLYVFYAAYLYLRIKILARSVRTEYSPVIIFMTFLHFIAVLILAFVVVIILLLSLHS